MRAIFYNPTLIGTVYQTIPECSINTPEQYKIRIKHTKWVKSLFKCLCHKPQLERENHG